MIDEQGASGDINYEYDNHSLFGRISYKEVEVSGGIHRRKFGKYGPAPVLAWSNNFNPDAGRERDDKVLVNAVWTHQFSDSLELRTYLHYNSVDRWIDTGEFGNVYAQLGAIDPSLIRAPVYLRSDGEVIRGQVQASWDYSKNLRLVGGAVAERRRTRVLGDVYDTISGDSLYRGTSQDVPIDIEDQGIYLQADGEIVESLKYTAGIRANFLDIGNNTYFTPRGALVYTPVADTSIKLLYGEAFRSPTPTEQYYRVPRLVFGADSVNRELDPENIESLQFGVDQTIGSYSIRVNGFRNVLGDNINRRPPNAEEEALGVGGVVYDNLGEIELRGFEAEVRGYPSKTFNFFANFSFMDSKDRVTGSQVDYNPGITSNAGIQWSIGDKWVLAPNVQYVGSRSGFLASGERNVVDEYITANMVAEYDLNSLASVQLSVHNLFDEEYFYPEHTRRNLRTIPGGPGRTIYVTLNYNL